MRAANPREMFMRERHLNELWKKYLIPINSLLRFPAKNVQICEIYMVEFSYYYWEEK